MTIIANPVYDSVFKFLMEDKKVAKILLSALLKKEILELEMKSREYTSMFKSSISLFRLDFSAKIRNADGTENLVLIELQKTWLMTETLRFRQYLGIQYLNQDNMLAEPNCAYGLPIITVYILGHMLGDLTEPVIYVRRRYLDYDENVIEQYDPFIESLTHDSIIVQIPFLNGRMRNRLERLLNVFNQKCQLADDGHYLEIDDEKYSGEEQLVINRLLRAAVAPSIRRDMQIEDEILSELEARDTTIMVKDGIIEEKEQLIRQKDMEIRERNKEIRARNKEIRERTKKLQEKEEMIKAFTQILLKKGLSTEEIARELNLSMEQLSRYL